MARDCVLGLDAGGTKTLAIVARLDGEVIGQGRAAGANYQACGKAEAGRQIGEAARAACRSAGIAAERLAFACCGVSGADRPRDFQVIREILHAHLPVANFRLENDTLLALRAGTPDGVGIALIAGTGANAVGRNRQGVVRQVGGLGPLSGDHGSAGHLARQAILACFRAADGRGPGTSLNRMICGQLGLKTIEDIVELTFFGYTGPPFDPGILAPLVFQAAAEGDAEALGILRAAGREIGVSVRVLLSRLFADDPEVHLVFGGSVFQKGACPEMIRTIETETVRFRDGVHFVRLEVEPALGAVAFALDGFEPISAGIWERLCDTGSAFLATTGS